MKINQNVIILNPGVKSTPVASGQVKAAAAGVLAAPDQVRQPSSTALLPSTTGDFDAARVAEIRESISAGRYQVNTGKIADGLLSTVHELLNRTPS